MAQSILTNVSNRIIRVFISSTFKDLDAERNYLAKKVFPLLRKKLEPFNITLIDVDLRWGITEDEAKNNKIVKVCLEQIDNTKPFFIGILGDRYGWIPTSEDCDDEYSKTYINKGLSITEIEIQHGVLCRKEKVNAAFFLRNTLNPQWEESPILKNKQQKLVKGIKESHYPYFEFSSEEQLGNLVDNLIMQWIEETYSTSLFSKLDIIEAEQAYIKNYRSINYVPCSNSVAGINKFINSDDKYLIVNGIYGSGKRAFTMYAAEYIREHKLADSVIEYYFENGGDESDIIDAEIHITKQIKEKIGYVCEENKWQNDYTQPYIFNKLSQSVCLLDPDKNWVLAIGGIQLFSTANIKKWINWIAQLPKHIKIIFTIDSHRSQLGIIKEIIFNAENYYYDITNLLWSENDRLNMIKQYFSFYGKTADSQHIDIILNSKKNIWGYNVFNNNLNLRLLLNEIRIYGNYDTLNNYIRNICDNTDDETHFYKFLLSNWQKEYDYKGNNMVIKVLCILLGSKNGVSEQDILKFTNTPAFKWQQFFVVLDQFVDYRNGLLCMHEGKRIIFLRILDEYIKDVIYQWIVYLEDCIKAGDRQIDYIYSELADRYKTWIMDFTPAHLEINNISENKIDSYLPDNRILPEDGINRLYKLIRPLNVASWFCDNQRIIALRKHWGYIERYGYNRDIYLKDIIAEGGATMQEDLFTLGCIYRDMEKDELVCHTYTTLINHSKNMRSVSMLYYNLAVSFSKLGKKEDAIKYIDMGCTIALDEYNNKQISRDDYLKLLLFKLTHKELNSVTNDEIDDIKKHLGNVTKDNILNHLTLYKLLADKHIKTNVDLALHYINKQIQLFEQIEYTDSLRIEYAYLLGKRGDLYYELKRNNQAIDDYMIALKIIDALTGTDYDSYYSGIIAYRIVLLGVALQREGINYHALISKSHISFSLLLYYRNGWESCIDNMVDTLELMGVVIGLNPKESHYKSYNYYLDEFEEYLKKKNKL